MTIQCNNPAYLRYLWRNNKITNKEYFFRLKAYQLNINTYKLDL